jgi:hypothetical protein
MRATGRELHWLGMSFCSFDTTARSFVPSGRARTRDHGASGNRGEGNETGAEEIAQAHQDISGGSVSDNPTYRELAFRW